MKSLQESIVQNSINESKISDFYQKYLKESDFLNKLKDFFLSTSHKLAKHIIIRILCLYYVMISKNVPLQEKMIACACIAYVLSPIDSIPDFMPAGLTDDIAMVTYTVEFLRKYINSDIEKRSEDTYNSWFDK